jgi:hypothetical protein
MLPLLPPGQSLRNRRLTLGYDNKAPAYPALRNQLESNFLMKKIITRTGLTAPVSGQYRPVGTRDEVTLSKGDRVPPYLKAVATFVLVDKTK